MDLSPREERMVQLLCQSRHRAILALLDEAGQPLHADELADRLVSRDAGIVSSTEYEDERESVLVSLHHNHLPKLAEADLIEYDRTRNVATYRGVQSVDTRWLNAENIGELLERSQGSNGIDEFDVGVLEGRENIVQRGRQLVGRANEELFLMVATTDLLEEQCLVEIRDAIDRGADVYVGSQNSSVRALASRQLPGVTLWEPQLDWLNAPSNYPRVGRLVLADREKVMFAVIDEPDLDGPKETAVTGEGTDNPLVVLVRELLGPRLDHLDYQSEDFGSELPFEL